MQLLTQGWLQAIDRNNAGKEEGWFSSGPTADARPASVPGIIQQVFPDYHGLAWD
jgi:hypothetical protein